MEQNFRSELSEELHEVDVESLKLDTAIQLRAWQKRMYALVDRTYKARLHDIDSIAEEWMNEIQEKQNQIKNAKVTDRKTYMRLKHDVDLLKSKIRVIESIPENLQTRIDRTVHVSRGEGNVDDEPILVDLDQDSDEDELIDDQDEQVPMHHEEEYEEEKEGRVAKILHSEPVQHSIAVGLAKAITQMTMVTATSTTTVAATTMAKTAIIATVCGVGTVAYGVGKIAFGTTRRIWSWARSSDE